MRRFCVRLRDLRGSQTLKVWGLLPIHSVQGPDTEVTRRAGTDANWPRLLSGRQRLQGFWDRPNTADPHVNASRFTP